MVLRDFAVNDLGVIGMGPPCDQLGDDEVAWGLEANGGFSVKSAYMLVKELDLSNEDNVWKKVWTWEGPAKIKQFMWLVTHGKLMTNEERRRRHIAPDANCPECQEPCESVEHVLRKCNLAQLVWKEMLSPPAGAQANLCFLDWWMEGITNSQTRLLFGVTAWLLWRRRNRLVFHNEKLSVSELCCQAKFWIQFYSSIWKALQVSRE
ncbi:Putative ribonuclease H protein At1g65750, partial [Linum perenne]